MVLPGWLYAVRHSLCCTAAALFILSFRPMCNRFGKASGRDWEFKIRSRKLEVLGNTTTNKTPKSLNCRVRSPKREIPNPKEYNDKLKTGNQQIRNQKSAPDT